MSVGEGFLLIVRWLHAISAVMWVGGSVFYLLVLRPAGKRYGAGWAVVNQAVASEFKGMTDTCILVLIATGAIMTFDRLSSGFIDIPYAVVLGVKILLALGMFYLALTRRRSLARPAPSNEDDSPASGQLPLWWKTARAVFGYNLVVILGVLIFLMADLLRLLVEKALEGG